jgi:hypothetical protein
LPAITSDNHGRNMRGIYVLLKKHIRVSNVVMERLEFGEYISCILNGNIKLIVFYRDPKQKTLADYSNCMSLFSDILNSDMPHVFMGDFNWS